MNSIDLTNVAICLIKQNEIVYIKKRKGLNYHIEYYLELEKQDEDVKRVIQKYDKEKLLLEPSKVHLTINKDLVANGICLILNMAPQVMWKTNLFTMLLTGSCTIYQEKKLKEIQNFDYSFFEFCEYDNSTQNFISYMQIEDYDKINTYLIENYLERKKYEKRV